MFLEGLNNIKIYWIWSMAYDRTCWYSLILMPVGHAFSCFPAIVIDDLHWFVWCCHCPSNEEKQIVWSHQVKLVCIKHAGSWLSTTLAAFTICLYMERYSEATNLPVTAKKTFRSLGLNCINLSPISPQASTYRTSWFWSLERNRW